MNHPLHYKIHKLFLADIDLFSIAKKLKQPTYIYSSKRILENLNRFRNAFSPGSNSDNGVKIHYAMKANSNHQVLKFLSKQRVGADVVSGGEIKRALECGFCPEQIIFSGVGKSEAEISYALKNDIAAFNVESIPELERIAQISKSLKKLAPISLRLNPDVDAKTHPYITTGFRENKFGIDQRALPALVKIFSKNKNSLKLIGLDFHIGSQVTTIKPFIEAVKKVIPIYKHLKTLGYPLTKFDIGGGLGIPYEKHESIDLSKYAKAIEGLLKPLDCEILTEPGRYLVGDGGVLLAQVEYVKKTPHKTFVILNTGMHHFMRPALYNAYHEILPVKKSQAQKINCDIVGPICETSDCLAKNRKISKPKQGEWLAISDAGAYGFVMASDYNLHAKAEEILV
jgi:diaminopimelate decarboxylase